MKSQADCQNEPIFPPIQDYGVIGNCHTAALVSSRGSIDYLCLPRFDSPSLFARILDLERGDAWSLQPVTPFESKHQYLDETNILQTNFTTASGCCALLDFMDITSDEPEQRRAAPGRLIRIVEGVEGTVELVSLCMPRPDYARAKPQFVGWGTDVTFGSFTMTSPVPWQIDPIANTLTCRITIQAGERIAFTLMTWEDLQLPHPAPVDAFATTVNYWQQWANQCTYQGPYRDAVIRSALALQLLTYAPSGAIIAAPTTSLPEKIGGERNWDYRFSWIRDASLTLYTLLLAGYLDDEKPFFDWVMHKVKLEKTGIKILYPVFKGAECTAAFHLESNSRWKAAVC
jgi:GH15 family glucan-1,4-alpha-glucosidase